MCTWRSRKGLGMAPERKRDLDLASRSVPAALADSLRAARVLAQPSRGVLHLHLPADAARAVRHHWQRPAGERRAAHLFRAGAPRLRGGAADGLAAGVGTRDRLRL